jgi:hypothetical protein
MKRCFSVSYPFPLCPSICFPLCVLSWLSHPQTNTKRQATQHGILPSLLGDRDKGIVIVYGEETNILYWADKISQGRTKFLCTCTASPTNQPRKDSFHLYSLSPHSPQFQQSAGATTFYSLSDPTMLVLEFLAGMCCPFSPIFPLYLIRPIICSVLSYPQFLLTLGSPNITLVYSVLATVSTCLFCL